MEKTAITKILVKVWQGKITEGQGLNQIQDEFIKNRNGPNNHRFWPTEVDDRLLYVLEQVRLKRVITTNEAEEEIREIIEEGIWKTRKKARIRKPQTEQSCCA